MGKNTTIGMDPFKVVSTHREPSRLAEVTSGQTAYVIAWMQPFPQQPDQEGNRPERNQKQDNDDHTTLPPGYRTVSTENRFSDAAHRAQDLAATH